MTLRIWIPDKPRKTYFSQTFVPSDFDCFLLKNSLSGWNLLEVFHVTDPFRPMRLVLHLLICHRNEVFWNFPRFLLFELALSLGKKTRKGQKFFNLWKVWTLFVKLSNTLPTLESRIIVPLPTIVNFLIFFHPGHFYSNPLPPPSPPPPSPIIDF